MSTTSTKDKAPKAKPAANTTIPAETHKAVVVKEVSLEQQINNKLAENNITRKVMNAMKDKYLTEDKTALKEDFILKDKTDKETYLIVKAERKNVRKLGIIVEDVCKKGREDAIAIQKKWLATQSDNLGEVATVQDKMDEQIKIYEDEQERLEKEEAERKDQQFDIRQTELIRMGAVPANGCLNLNETSIETSLIREADEETYNETILPLFQRQYEINNQKKVEEENRQKKEREEFELKQKQFQEQQEQMRQQQEQLDKQKREFEQQQRDLQKQKIDNRCLQLEALGMKFSFQYNAYTFMDVNIDNATELCLWDDATWETKLQEIKPVIEQRKKDAAEKEERKTKRSADLSALGMTFTGTAYKYEDINIPATDLTGMSNDNWNQLIATTTPMITDRKDKAEKKKQEEWQRQQDEQKKQEEQRRLEEEAKASDKEKWDNFIEALGRMLPPTTMRSGIYKNKSSQAVQKLNEIKAL